MCYQELFTFAMTAFQAQQQQRVADAQTKALQEAKNTSKVAPPPPTSALTRNQNEGYTGTLLTSPQGLAPGSQNLGSNTLLGR